MTPEERNFRRFENTVCEIVSAYPKAVTIEWDREQFTPATIEARLRDAIKDFAAEQYDSKISKSWFHNCYIAGIVVRRRGDVVKAGSREATKFTNNEQVTSAILPSTTIIVEQAGVLQAIATLMKHGIIHGPIICRDLNPNSIPELEETYNIAVEDNKDGTYTLL